MYIRLILINIYRYILMSICYINTFLGTVNKPTYAGDHAPLRVMYASDHAPLLVRKRIFYCSL